MNIPSASSSSSASSSTPHHNHIVPLYPSLKRSADYISDDREPSPPAKRVKELMASDDHIELDDHLRLERSEDISRPEEQPEISQAEQERPDDKAVENEIQSAKATKFVDEMEEELMCGCCAALLYHPVIISPCGHYFCGSCTVLWVRNGGTSCPACRQPSTSVQHSRLLESFVDVLLRTYPEKLRPQAERDQADEIYNPSMSISIPQPKPPNQDNVLLPQSRAHDPPPDNLARPCPHCLPNNEFGWRCPRPLADPQTDPEHAWNLNNGTPPDHAWCATCDELHPVNAPSTTKCSVCEASFCGISVPHLCVANHMSTAHLPPGVSNLSGMIQTGEVYEAFHGNTTEVELLFDWLREDGRGPRGILLSMIETVRASPGGFQALIEQGVFTRQHDDDGASDAPPPPPPANVPEPAFNEAGVQVPEAAAASPTDPAEPTPAGEPIPALPPPPPSYNRICRDCAYELFLFRLYDWWAVERQAVVDAANAPPPSDPAADPISGSDNAATGDAPPPPPPAIVDEEDGDSEEDSDDGMDEPRVRSDRSRDRGTMLPAWATSLARRDCVAGRMCAEQLAPSHAREFNHVILVREAPAPAPQEVIQPPQEAQVPSAQPPAAAPPPPPAVVEDALPPAAASITINTDVEMSESVPPPPPPPASSVLKIEALLSAPMPNSAPASRVEGGSIVGAPSSRVEEDTTMADAADVEQSLAAGSSAGSGSSSAIAV